MSREPDRRRFWSVALLGAVLALGLVWLVFKTLGWSVAKTSAPVTYEAYPEPVGAAGVPAQPLRAAPAEVIAP